VNPQMRKTLDWIRTNVVVVVAGAVAIIGVVGLPIVAGSMNASLQKDMAARSQQFNTLSDLQRTDVTLPSADAGAAPATHQVVVNAALLERFRAVNLSAQQDSDQVTEAARKHNQRTHQPALAGMFPSCAQTAKEVMPRRFHGALAEAYASLTARVRMGPAPASDELLDEIERRRRQFITNTLFKAEADKLTPEEETKLNEYLAQARISAYTRAAEDLLFYSDPNVLPVPQWDQSRTLSWVEMFGWQWDFWVVDDVLTALAAANGAQGNVLRSPVKHLLGVWIDPIAGGSAGGSEPSGGSGFGFGQDNPGGQPGAAQGPVPMPADPKGPFPVDFAVSLTGRKTNPFYDIRNVQIDLVVATPEIVTVLDAISQQNFMSILDVRLSQIDVAAAARKGYFYGAAPVSRVTLQVETIWFRTWTGPLMPDDLKKALGVPMPEAAVPSQG